MLLEQSCFFFFGDSGHDRWDRGPGQTQKKLIFRLQAPEATFQNLIATSSERETLVPMTDKRPFASTRRMGHLGGARLQGVATVKILGRRRGHLRTFGVSFFFFSKTQ